MRRVIATLAALALTLAMFPATVLADTTGGYGNPPAAGSSNGVTIEIKAVQLIAKVVVQVEASIVCQPKPPSVYPIRSYWEERSIAVWATQASGRAIAYAMSYSSFDAEAMCDGQPHTIIAAASADSSGVPFKNGNAAVAVAVHASYWWENEEDWTSGWESGMACTGWMPVRLRK
jgi:hypothetical protein